MIAQAPGSLAADLRAGLVVFLVALPLCLGIANASGAPPIAGIIAGVLGGLIVGIVSKSELSIAGPAAGLTVVVLDGVNELGWTHVLTATVLAGAFQVLFGALRLGRFAHFVPNAVLKGMLAAIGLLLILKQVPHAVGWDFDYEGDFGFFQRDGRNTFTELIEALEHLHPGACLIAVLCTVAILAWRDWPKVALNSIVPAPLIVVVLGSVSVLLLGNSGLFMSELEIAPSHRVDLPSLRGFLDGADTWSLPAIDALGDLATYKLAIVLSLVASLESLLSVEATDQLDPHKRVTPPDRELAAQGLGNIASGLAGGLPVTAVIVRSFTNIAAGGRTRRSGLTHAVLLCVCVVLAGRFLEYIPLAALAVILIHVGSKLTRPELYRELWRKGVNQFAPFLCTIIAILATDLLIGTAVGIVVGLAFVIRANFESAILVTEDGLNRFVKFTGNVSFLNKGKLKSIFQEMEEGSVVVVDGTRSRVIDPDILETIQEFQAVSNTRGISVHIWRSSSAAHPFFRSIADEAT